LFHSTSSDYHLNKTKIDWQTEAKLLSDEGIICYAIQALNYRGSDHFYTTLANVTGGLFATKICFVFDFCCPGVRLSLDQFAESPDFVRAICYREVGPEHLQVSGFLAWFVGVCFYFRVFRRLRIRCELAAPFRVP
jgi:hypothetical protein